jgi:hypothetical protein
MKFKTLRITDEESLEKRVLTILNHVFQNNKDCRCFLSRLDAIGAYGGSLTDQLNDNSEINLHVKDLQRLFSEDGQVFEARIKITINVDSEISIDISDGTSIDLYEVNYLIPDNVIKNYDFVEDI